MIRRRKEMKSSIRHRGDSRDALERVDFDDPRVIANIERAANEFDTQKYADRLEQFETTVAEGALSLVIK